jgi:putative two-component system response regulator
MTTAPQDSSGDDVRILVVDDEEQIRDVLCRLLSRSGYPCEAAPDAEQAIALLNEKDFGLVLSDVDMPGPSGLDFITEIAREHPDTATVMVTGMDDAQLADTALDVGAYGYIIKPFEANEILINVSNAIRRRKLEMENRTHRMRLEHMVKDRTAHLWEAIARLERAESDLRTSREETIERLAIAAGFRHDETAPHIQRMSRYCGLLSRRAGLDSETSETIRVASLMHDVGKIGIPDYILLKAGPLTEEERSVMERHSDIGYRILAESSSALLETAAHIARTHHERVDGTGYPRALEGEAIPIEGRIAAIADVFDALTSDRVYKTAFPLVEAVDTMRKARAVQFDAELLDVFLGVMDEVLEIKEQYADS